LGQLVDVLDHKRVPVSAKERASRSGEVPYYGASGQVGWIDKPLFDEPLLLLGEDGVQFFDPAKSKAYVIDGPAWVNNHAHVLRARHDLVERRFLVYYLNWTDFHGFANGTTRLKLTKSAMTSMPIPLPSLDEQRRIIEILEDHLSRLDAAQSLLSTARTRLEAYKASVRDVGVTGGAGRVSVGADLPPGWRWASVEEFADSAKGSMTIGPFGSNLKVIDYRASGVPLVFVRNVRTAAFGRVGCRYVTPEKAAELRAHGVEPGDVVVTKMGAPPGDAAVYRADGPGVVTADVIRIRPAACVDPDYLALALNSGLVRQQIADITRGVAQQKVSLARYRSEVLVPTPAFDAQAAVAIACAEDLAAASRVETATRALEVKLSALKRSLLAAAFSGRLVS